MLRTIPFVLVAALTTTSSFAGVVTTDAIAASPVLQGNTTTATPPRDDLWNAALAGGQPGSNAASSTIQIPNPTICTLTQMPDGTVVGSCAPVNSPNEVPAPNGLLVMMAALLGFAFRRKVVPVATRA